MIFRASVVAVVILTIATLACSSAPPEVAAPASQAPAVAPAAPAPAPAQAAQQPQSPAAPAPAAPAQQAFQSQVVPAPAQPIAQPTKAAARTEPAPAAMMGAGDVRRGGHLFWGVGPRVFPPKWDMTQAGVWHFTEHFNRHYSGILQFNPRNGIDVLPDLGDSWEFAPTVDEITVNLVEGVMWHDDNPLTVEDIEFTLDRWETHLMACLSLASAASRTSTAPRRLTTRPSKSP